MRALPLLAITLALATADAAAQITVDFTVDTRRDTFAISPYIFGSNGQSDDRDERVAAVRSGGNRLTGYNWENNASNAGDDYIHHSDNYLTRFLPAEVQNVPGITLTSFHDSARALDAYSLVTLPAAGYVARDKNGTVSQAETAPSNRWDEVRFAKGAPFSLTPDLGDGVVYVDEEVNHLVETLGRADAGGIRGYAIDNEPALWPSTHPRIHPAKTTVTEVIDRSIALAGAVKSVDPTAEIFGAVSYGFSEYYNMQDATDWSTYASHGTFIDAFLAKMREAGTAQGRRLVDVLDLHWYPEARGTAANGEEVRITLEENSDRGVAIARMQAPRSLWDSTYREKSWIGEWFSPIALVPAMQARIASGYPGTKLAFTEINYGGSSHISGGIAMADVLGIFADHRVYMSNHWGPIDGYTSSAYRIYRNYDGNGADFGDVRVHSSASDYESASIHASIAGPLDENEAEGTLHIVAINRNPDQPVNGRFTIASERTYGSAAVYGFDAGSSEIRLLASSVPVSGGTFSYTLPPLTVAHTVLRPTTSAAPIETAAALSLDIVAPNPATNNLAIRFTLAASGPVSLSLVDGVGRESLIVPVEELGAGGHVRMVSLDGIAPGAYHLVLRAGGAIVQRLVTVVR